MNYKQVNCFIKKVTAFAFPAGTLQSIKNSTLSLLNNEFLMILLVQKLGHTYKQARTFTELLMDTFLVFIYSLL